MVEKYFDSLTSESNSKESITPMVKEITGIIDESTITGNERTEYVKEKYS